MEVSVSLGRPKDLQKRARILQAAKDLFLQQGYDGSSMNKIAKMACVTKLTVYNHFQDKATLFVCAIEHACSQHMKPEQLELYAHSDFNHVLRSICQQSVHICYLPEAIKLEHLMLQLAASHNNSLVETFFNAAHQRLNSAVSEFLSKAALLGFIQTDDPQRQTELLMSLLGGSRHRYVLLGMQAAPDAATRQQIVNDAVDLFMRKYGT